MKISNGNNDFRKLNFWAIKHRWIWDKAVSSIRNRICCPIRGYLHSGLLQLAGNCVKGLLKRKICDMLKPIFWQNWIPTSLLFQLEIKALKTALLIVICPTAQSAYYDEPATCKLDRFYCNGIVTSETTMEVANPKNFNYTWKPWSCEKVCRLVIKT